MNKKGIVLTCLSSILLAFLFSVSVMSDANYKISNAKKEDIINNQTESIYQVYIDGQKIGLIESKDALYNLINEEQVEIKKKYSVDQVYPPKGFQIIKTNTYSSDLSTPETVYDEIKDEKTFTIKGYSITIKSGEDGVEPTYIYVIDKTIFEKAINNVVETFIGKERFEQYKEGTQPDIVDVGYKIENIYFNDEITIKESYISVDEKIYTDETELTKFLLFGNNMNYKEYKVNQGDTLETIAYANQLNTSELLIANDELKSEDTLLQIGQTLNVALINPLLKLVYEEIIVEDVEVAFTTIYEEDATQYTDYRLEKQAGINGINRIKSYAQFTNGEQNQGGYIMDTVEIRPVQNKIIVKGTKVKSGISGSYVDTGDTWGWPTNQPSIITSHFGYRWGTIHEGMDISGTGYGSPIYAALDGLVIASQYGGMVGSSAGYNVIIEHSNGYYSVYAHCSALYARPGDYVHRGDKIAAMGASGMVTGTHLHFGLFYGGKPYNGGRAVDPRRLWHI